MHGFEFERLRVFDAAADAATEVNRLTRRIPVVYRALRDQVSRSSISVPLNIAEGADEYSVAEKIRFYRMARRSAAESAAALALLVRFGVFMPNEVARSMMLLNRTAAMLTTMMSTLEDASARPARDPRGKPSTRVVSPRGQRSAPDSTPADSTKFSRPTAADSAATPTRATGPGPGPVPRPASPQ
ncbi:MAG: four helix bundle protein [Longimicrobiales bacterium]